MVITAVNSVTPVGISSEMTAASVRAGICRLAESTDYFDMEGNPITVANVDYISDDEDDVKRMQKITHFCFDKLLEKYSQNGFHSDREIHILLGVASKSRPGPRYEGEQLETI